MKSIFITLFLTLVGLNYNLVAQESKSQKILNKLSNKIKGLKSFYIEFDASIKNTSSGQNETQSGKAWVKGNKYYANYGNTTLISNHMKTWTVMTSEKEVYESEADDEEDALNPKKLMTIWETGFDNKYEKLDKIGSQEVHVIQLTPKKTSKATYSSITIYISKSDNELKKATLKSKDGTTMVYSITKFTANPNIAETKFSFDKKNFPGYKVIKN